MGEFKRQWSDLDIHSHINKKESNFSIFQRRGKPAQIAHHIDNYYIRKIKERDQSPAEVKKQNRISEWTNYLCRLGKRAKRQTNKKEKWN